MTTHRLRLADLERLAATRLPARPDEVPDNSPLISDLPTIRWNIPEAAAAFRADWDLLERHSAATAACDWTSAEALAQDTPDASLALYAVIPRADETADEWRARSAALPVAPIYRNLSATW